MGRWYYSLIEEIQFLTEYLVPIIFASLIGILGFIGYRYYKFKKKYGNMDLNEEDYKNLWRWK